MIAEVRHKQSELADLCRTYGVRRLEVFGSAATGDDFDAARSDLDFLVEFDSVDDCGPADQYFGLLESLERLFERKVDLVTRRSLRNPYFIKSVDETRQVLYAS